MVRAAALVLILVSSAAGAQLNDADFMEWTKTHAPYGLDVYPDGKVWLSAGQSTTGAKYAMLAEDVYRSDHATVTTWIRGDYASDRTTPYRRSMQKVTFYCARKSILQGVMVTYKADESVRNNLPGKYQSEDVLPSSIGEWWLEVACQK